MTRKELQKWLDQFPPDAEMWQTHDTGWEVLNVDCILFDCTDEIPDPLHGIEGLPCWEDWEGIDFAKIKKIIF